MLSRFANDFLHFLPSSGRRPFVITAIRTESDVPYPVSHAIFHSLTGRGTRVADHALHCTLEFHA